MQFIVSNWENTYVKDTKLITQEELELQIFDLQNFLNSGIKGKITYLIWLERIISWGTDFY